MNGLIRDLPRERVERRDDVRLPAAWVEAPTNPGVRFTGHGWLAKGENSPPVAADRGAPLLVMLPTDGAAAWPELITHAVMGERAYVLVPPTWGTTPIDSRLLSAPKVLIRRVPEVPVAGIHRRSGARLWLGRSATSTPWTLKLDAAQSEAFRQVFLRLFWHHATHEAWTGGKALTFRPAADRPFDVPELPDASPVRLVEASTRLDHGTDAHVYLNAVPEKAARARRLWVPAGSDNHERQARQVREGVEIVWDDLDLPDLAVGPAGGTVLVAGDRARLRVALTPAQGGDATQVLQQPARWNFRVDLRVGDPTHRQARIWLAGQDAPATVDPEQELDAGLVPAPRLRGLADGMPAAWPSPHPLALTVRYRWMVAPPRLQSGSEEDALVGRWRKLDEEWATRVGRVRELLASADGRRGHVARAFSRLMGAMMGFERTHGGLLGQLAALEAQRPSVAGPVGCASLLPRLAELEDQVSKLQGDIDEAERRAREEQEREEQHTAWEARVESAKRELGERRTAVAEIEAKRRDLSGELSTIEEDLKEADKEARKDLTARQRRLSDDLSRANKDLKRLRGEAEDLDQRVTEPFEFRPSQPGPAAPSKPGGRFVPAASGARRTPLAPEEALPVVGALRQRKGERYLVIQNWEELAAGEQAAEQLAATLVAPEDT
jgi:hypothetical protein